MNMFICLFTAISCKRYAVLFAGSKSWANYRHQADICTFYKSLLNRGFSKSEITLMMYDDLATSTYNPFSGQIFHELSHVNVYPGSDAINYRGDDVTADNFYKVLTSLPSTAEDYVFVFYDNHGGPDTLDDPTGGKIRTTPLNEALNQMYIKRLYKYCFFGIEACYSGSLAEKFTAPNMAIITAANEKESSYAAIYDSSLSASLTNEFTRYWLEEMDRNPTQTISDFYYKLKENIHGSHVMYYGNEDMKKIAIDNFLGIPKTQKASIKSYSIIDTLPQREATETSLRWMEKVDKMRKFEGTSLRKQLEEQTMKLDRTLSKIVKIIDPENYEWIMKDRESPLTEEFQKVLDVFYVKFGKMNPDDLGKMMVLKALTKNHSSAEIIRVINQVL
ncbi:Clan CD, family C13, asparaginyl endopeptidase-like cysteine peptidase [Histomonas meleagridis]|uniref:Clan CD, family C13, asparaginyl endopeptidase-like cysteine peptidase n=1 Tax=Histomonas meleagridis TaxID=135588 RepID=UPI0035598A28|nr:Clan CD, family C13, asparaginyl endopeptidase-like cysteine peptidase [Histomonas meleagridis]KAH0805360.1 Clan CD, family C13, asparaginyl endopeptidase-like cysteine peptidase [Histomonas meleagridis]